MTPYVALYRKYRPRSFAELVGQEAIAKTLASAITQQRLGHAYLFTGPRGTGKTSVARILAKSVNCKQGPTDHPCGECSSCLGIMNGNDLDVIEIDAASNNGVDNIRDLQDRVALAPVGGRYKIYIIDEVHMLSQGAFNALLKTLEEPPSNVLFILATTDPHKVLPTIISRCQRFDFGRIALAPLVARLRHVADAEGITIEAAAVEAIARRAQGGLRDALSLLDQMAAMSGGGAIAMADVGVSLGLLAGETVAAMGRSLLTGDAPAALTVASEVLAAGHDHATLLRELLAHFRHLLVLSLAPERADALDVPLAERAELTAQAALATQAELAWVLETLNETEAVARRSPQQAIWLELGLIKIASRPAVPSVRELAERVAALEARLADGTPLPAARRAVPEPAVRPSPPPAAPAPTVAAPLPPPPAPPPLVIESTQLPPRPPLAEKPVAPTPERPAAPVPAAAPVAAGSRVVPPGAWERLREHVRGNSVPTAALLDQQAAIVRWDADGAVVIRIAKAYKDMFDRQAPKKRLLQEAVAAVFGKEGFPRLEAAEAKSNEPRSTPAGRPAAPAVEAPPAPAPFPVPAPVVVATPAPAVESHDDDAPPAWLDDLEDSRPAFGERERVSSPPPPAPVALAMPVTASAPAAPATEEGPVKLAVELFNGRVVRPPDPDPRSASQ